MSPASRPRGAIGRVVLILAVSAAILVFAVYQGRAIMGYSERMFSVRSGPPVTQPVEGSTFLRSYPVLFNGIKTQFGHYASTLKAEDVIREYTRKLTSPGDSSDAARPVARAPMITGTGSGCSALSYVTSGRTTVGIVAFDDPDSGGSHYFVGVMDATAPPAGAEGDCPGREPPGVPKPARCTRTLSIENLGGVASVVNLYEAWGRPSEIADSVRHEMSENRWLERSESSSLLSKNYAGHALLSFSRGHEQCVVAVDQDARTGKILVVLFWAERPWLPKGVAL